MNLSGETFFGISHGVSIAGVRIGFVCRLSASRFLSGQAVQGGGKRKPRCRLLQVGILN